MDEADSTTRRRANLPALFGQRYQLITREERYFDRIAVDLVDHFPQIGFAGKAMVISIDKATAVRMYDGSTRCGSGDSTKRTAAGDTDLADYMASTGMAVVVSQAQNRVADMAAKGLDITSHRARMVNDDLGPRFKDPADPLRIVFVCAMWTTVLTYRRAQPSILDKPMKNHTLMQTIARKSVFPEKTNGLIVDYVGVFRNLEKALAIYASPGEGRLVAGPTERRTRRASPNQCTADAVEYCTKHGGHRSEC